MTGIDSVNIYLELSKLVSDIGNMFCPIASARENREKVFAMVVIIFLII